LGVTHEIWQRGFSDKRVRDRASFLAHRAYIGQNPVERGLATSADEYPYSSFYLRKQKKVAGAKAQIRNLLCGTTEVVP
jgi:hypothetical protein